MIVPMTVAVSAVSVPMSINCGAVGVDASVAAAYVAGTAVTYEGEYEFTPSAETQTVQTADRLLLRDIVINPIPSNYGLIHQPEGSENNA